MKKNPKYLLETLVKTGVCETGKRYLETTEKDLNTLIKVWKQWPEYLNEHSQIAISQIRRFITNPIKKELEANNLFVDYSGSIELSSDPAVFFIGASDTIVNIKDWAVVKIYIYNEAKIKVNAGLNSFVSIEAFDNSKVSIEQAENAKIIIYSYDNSEASGNATIHKKEYVRGEIFNGKELPDHEAKI